MTNRLNIPNLLLDMANNNRPCLRRWVQGRRNGLADLNACQQAVGEHSRLFGRHLHPSVPGKFDNCKKGAVQSPRAMVMFAIAYKALGDLVPKYSGSLVAVCMFLPDIHQWLLILHQDIVYSPGLDFMHLAISCLRQSKLVLGPRG